MVQATLHDGRRIDVEVRGDGPTVLLAVNPVPASGERARELRDWGMDPALGRSLIEGLNDRFRVVAFDYEGDVLAHPKPDTLTPDTIAADVLAVADAVGADRFAYYGYSWLALTGLQLAIRTDRLTGLAMGGYPPVDGPYEQMLAVTTATHAMATGAPSTPPSQGAPEGEFDWSSAEMTMSEPQTRQFMTLYQALRDFDDRAAQARLSCPRLCFAGTKDTIVYDERWGGVTVDIAGPLAVNRAELTAAGWDVHLLDGLDHTTAMQPSAVLPILRPWLVSSSG
ncbi:alpha/beta hydrolase [Actinosynnema sp. ALI-1.44]|uniref:alpha/beta fold hydrolase n=1 Tax=Actinosynnema sp. ALI-1.44 TaxID=1933779 RepID=UPI00097BAAF5|nr:alpha/beta hydrolase [Actinosynnema sp. ALI-1.44]ONI79798.1 alpha/beta hydrolase [Actinosynnema sp. ALI-1.44]